jgi:hypothetical protein
MVMIDVRPGRQADLGEIYLGDHLGRGAAGIWRLLRRYHMPRNQDERKCQTTREHVDDASLFHG